ncbi:MAG: hypothetical protein HW380_3941, partial [Magnetococcales bacterium]|nr:hypothetical protein [Magnetococcales bacterium]
AEVWRRSLQGFGFELKQKSFIAYGGLGAKPPRCVTGMIVI